MPIDAYSALLLGEGGRRLAIVWPESRLFNPGTVDVMPDAVRVLAGAESGAVPFVIRHIEGDFGDIEYDQREKNWKAIDDGFGSIWSYYQLGDETVMVCTMLHFRFTAVSANDVAIVQAIKQLPIEGEGVWS